MLETFNKTICFKFRLIFLASFILRHTGVCSLGKNLVSFYQDGKGTFIYLPHIVGKLSETAIIDVARIKGKI